MGQSQPLTAKQDQWPAQDRTATKDRTHPPTITIAGIVYVALDEMDRRIEDALRAASLALG